MSSNSMLNLQVCGVIRSRHHPLCARSACYCVSFYPLPPSCLLGVVKVLSPTLCLCWAVPTGVLLWGVPWVAY